MRQTISVGMNVKITGVECALCGGSLFPMQKTFGEQMAADPLAPGLEGLPPEAIETIKGAKGLTCVRCGKATLVNEVVVEAPDEAG